MIAPMEPDSEKMVPNAIGMMRPSTAQPATALSLKCDMAMVT